MQIRKYFFYILTLICLLFCLIGCSEEEEVDSEQEGEEVLLPYQSMEEEGALFLYTTSPMRPRVLPDCYGYEPEDEKVVLCLGNNREAVFEVVDYETDKVVYTGVLEEKEDDPVTGELVCQGDFTGLHAEGHYYIRTALVGESYPFYIKEGICDEIFQKALLDIDRLWPQGVSASADSLAEDAKAIHNLLIALEYYTQLFSDDLGIAESGNAIPDALDLAGRLAMAVQEMDIHSLTGEDLCYVTGILASCGQGYKNFDKSLSSQYVSAAEKAYSQLKKAEAQADAELMFYAAAQLYRANGQTSVREDLSRYLEEHAADADCSDYGFYGRIAYLSCKYSVDTSYCSRIMNALMNQVENLSKQAENEPFCVYSTELWSECDAINRLALINYVITNHEYVKVQQNHLHFLLGRNPQGACYLEGYGRRMSNVLLSDHASLCASLVLELCEIRLEENGT